MPKTATVTTEEFIERANRVHNGKYDYPEFQYNGYCKNINVTCPIHGLFLQRYDHHLNGSGCKKCATFCVSNSQRSNRDEFISKAQVIHGDKFDYSLVEYINARSKVWIICKEHGKFLQKPDKHLHGRGCPKCKFAHAGETQRYTTEQFIVLSKKIHGDCYGYDLVDYKNRSTPVTIICKKHGKFTQVPDYHLSGNGCLKCSASKGELRIEKFLKENSIEYEMEKTFPTCKSKRKLKFDFFLPTKNILIEYDGVQHFKIGGWNDAESFEKLKKRDAIKTDWAKKNGIELIRIGYDKFDSIEEILSERLEVVQC